LLSDVLPEPVWQLALSAGPLALALVLARRSRDVLTLRLVVIVTVALLACVLAYAQIRGIAYGYLVKWSRAVAMFLLAAPLVAIARRYQSRHPLDAESSRSVAAIAMAMGLATVGIRAIAAPVPVAWQSAAYAKLMPSAVEAVPPGTAARVIGLGPAFTASPEALAVALDRAGRSPWLVPWLAHGAGAHRTIPNETVLPTIVLAIGNRIDEMRRRPGARLIDKIDPLTPEEHAEAYRLRTKLARALHDANRDDLRPPLDDAALWFPLVMPPSLDPTEVDRYLKLAGGEARLEYALFVLEPTAW